MGVGVGGPGGFIHSFDQKESINYSTTLEVFMFPPGSARIVVSNFLLFLCLKN